MPEPNAPNVTPRTFRRLVREIGDRAAITYALVQLATRAARDVVNGIPPAVDRGAVARLEGHLTALHDSATRGRRLARRLRAATGVR